MTLTNTKLELKNPTPYLNALGLVAFVLFLYLALIQSPVIIIAMITLGAIGSLSNLPIRMIGNRLMQWKVREEVR